MKYSRENLEGAIVSINVELRALREKKGHDYATEEDVLSNVRLFGWRGIVVRIGDKWSRLLRFCHSGAMKVLDETIEDTMLDMINYLLFCLILYRGEKPCPE